MVRFVNPRKQKQVRFADLFLNGLQFFCPVIFIFELAPLDAGERIVEVLGQRADLALVDDKLLTLVAELADRRALLQG